MYIHRYYHSILNCICIIHMSSIFSNLKICDAVQDSSCSCSTYHGCNWITGILPGNSYSRQNIALGKVANITSRWSSNNDSSAKACAAVNGNTSRLYGNDHTDHPNCVLTGLQYDQSWVVDLGQNYTITDVTVYTYQKYEYFMSNLTIYVDEEECDENFNTDDVVNIRCTKPLTGQLVRLYRNGTLAFCEVQIWICRSHLFGEYCNHTCNCKENTTCDNYFGTCLSGCANGYYGPNCRSKCGHCQENTTCNFSGTCYAGCRNGWQSPDCINECESGRYGKNCNKTCGKCEGSVPCDLVGGHCSEGCQMGWTSPTCDTEITHAESTGDSVGGIVGGVIGAVVVVIAVIVTLFILRRRRLSKSFSPVSEPRSNKRCTQEYKQPAPVKPHRPNSVPECRVQAVDVSDIYSDTDNDIYNTKNVYSTFTSQKQMSSYDAFQQSLISKMSSNTLSTQFKELKRKMDHPHLNGLTKDNIKKNRFESICPYDYNRVILRRHDGVSDYINASYIKGHNREKAYIAAQGPLRNTIDDMWLMIWQESISDVVMLTNLKEDGQDKCDKYWPEIGTKQIYGSITVSCLKSKPRDYFTVCTFLVQKENTLQRHVKHYHFVTWPDQGVPTVTSLVIFWRYIHDRAPKDVPLLVHCSTGAGRTGTYIALDIALDMSEFRSDINVKKIVSDLREERPLMVQTEDQYRLLFEVILEAYTDRSTRQPTDQVENYY